ncbi:cytochrome P450 [Dichomitus squalens LYAD-421 SS1]|uniref:Cytochrome P450 n=2 Tax=Dichomitus squalens TaxID=114155 RepID=A0A4Q9PLQ3_9APHY|nr:cytochrome P450 [Dichomitus squalens LYAD-421 SS1]EJF57473.1 cytochrome P450 [Dichomitus squalens LYAD-421 SS1]TBU55140.1 cytochrome P450 [Dichomitus squalens]
MSVLNTLDTWTLALVVLTFSGTLLYIAYPDRLVTTNARPDLPGPKGHPLVGNSLQAIPWQTRILDWFNHLLSDYGPACTFTILPWGRGILINRPEWLAHIKQADMKMYSRGPYANKIFHEFPGGRAPVASEGAQWRLARKSIYPIFTVRSFTDHVSHAMNEIVPIARALLLSASKKGVPIDWSDFAGRIAITIFTRSHINEKTNILEGDVSCLDRDDPLRDALVTLNQISAKRLFNPVWQWSEILSGERWRFNHARSFIRRRVEDIWVDRLREEAMAIRDPTREAEYSEVARYHVHLAVFYETVRLWPGLPKNARLALQDDILPALPEHNLPAVKVEKGDYVFWSDYHMMRNEDVWGPTAHLFDPGRHLDAEGHFVKPSPAKFNCFGAGPRFCPGQQLVMYEFIACLSGILPYFDFAPSKGATASGLIYQKPELAESFTASLNVPLVVDVRARDTLEVLEGRL